MDKILACTVLKTHGIHGELKIKVLLEDWDLYYTKIIDKNYKHVEINKSRIFDKKHNYYLVHLNNINKVEEAINFVTQEWYIKISDLKPEEHQCFYYYKLINLPVEDEDGNSVGFIEDINNIAHSDNLIIRLNIGKIMELPFNIYMFPKIENDKIIISKDRLEYIFQ